MRNLLAIVVSAVAIALAPLASAAETTADEAAALSRGVLLSPRAFRAAAKKVATSLVRIEGFGGLAGSVGTAGFQPPGEGPTTGLVISSDGYIVTSTFNFLRKPPVITVVLPGGERKVAKLLGRDETRKLCLLKIDGVSNLPVPELAPRDEIKVGQWAVALGVGFGGNEPALSAGIVSATHRISGKAIQTDANLSPANYGGPLVDLDGRVIGLCVPLSPQGKDAAAGAEWYDSGIGFAVPLAENAERIEGMKQGKTFLPPFLGVQAKPHGTPPAGAQIADVVADAPAAKAGLQKDDKLLAVDDAPVLDVTHLTTLIGRYVAGDKVTLKIDRAGETKTIEVELAVPPAEPPKPAPMPAPMPGPVPPKPTAK